MRLTGSFQTSVIQGSANSETSSEITSGSLTGAVDTGDSVGARGDAGNAPFWRPTDASNHPVGLANWTTRLMVVARITEPKT